MTNKDKLKRFFQRFESRSKVLIIINADPDSIGSAMAVKRLLWRKTACVHKTCFNTVTRPDNLAMIELTESELIPFSDIDPDHYDRFVVVDSQPDHHERFSKFSYDVIIDHHAVTCPEAGFVDIRPEYGACSTLMTEYLKAAKIKPSHKLAAALMLGIKTDTADFTRQTGIKDIRAFQYLYRFADMNLVTKVQRSVITLDDLDFLSLAVKKRTIINNRAYFHKGRAEKPDELVMVADFFLGIAGVNWSIISGVFQNRLIIVLRNDGLRKGAGNTAKEAFESFGSAGGHKTMARAELSMSRIRKEIGSVSRESVAAWIISRVEESAGKKFNRENLSKLDRANALYTSEQRYRTLVETMGDGLSEINEHQVATYANDQLCRMWGRNREAIVGQRVTEFLDEDNQNILKQQYVLRRQGIRKPYEISWTRPDGTQISTIMTPTPYFDENGRFKGSFAVVTDISEHKKEQQRLEQAHDEMEDRVARRTSELQEKTRSLEDVNTALRVLLKKSEEDEVRLEQRMVANIRELVFPYIEQMKAGSLDRGQKACLNTIESILNEIASPFLTRLSLDYRGLTPSEIRVAHLVKHGVATKEIAQMLNLSVQTIEFYRKKIRKKLDLTNQSINLRTFLNSIG